MWVEHDGENILESDWRGSRQFPATWRCSTVRNCVGVLTASAHSNTGQETTWGRKDLLWLPVWGHSVCCHGRWIKRQLITLSYTQEEGDCVRSRLGQSSRTVLQRSSSSWNPPPNGPTTSPNSTISWGPRTQAYEVEKDILHPNKNTEGNGGKDSSGSKNTGVNIHFPSSWKEMTRAVFHGLSWSLLWWGWEEATHISQNLLYDRLSACLTPPAPTVVLPPGWFCH